MNNNFFSQLFSVKNFLWILLFFTFMFIFVNRKPTVMENKLSVLYVPFPDQDSAERMAIYLIENQFVGCCNIIPSIFSIYSWNQQIEKNNECILIIKTIEEKLKEVINIIENQHPYQIPCILNLKDGSVNLPYFEWVKGYVK